MIKVIVKWLARGYWKSDLREAIIVYGMTTTSVLYL